MMMRLLLVILLLALHGCASHHATDRALASTAGVSLQAAADAAGVGGDAQQVAGGLGVHYESVMPAGVAVFLSVLCISLIAATVIDRVLSHQREIRRIAARESS